MITMQVIDEDGQETAGQVLKTQGRRKQVVYTMEPVQWGNQRVDGGVEVNRTPAWNHQNQSKHSKNSHGSTESEENVFVKLLHSQWLPNHSNILIDNAA